MYQENIIQKTTKDSKNKLSSLILALAVIIVVNFEHVFSMTRGIYDTSRFLSEVVFRGLVWTLVAFTPFLFVVYWLSKKSSGFEKVMAKAVSGSFLALGMTLLFNGLFFNFFDRYHLLEIGAVFVPIFWMFAYLVLSAILAFLATTKSKKGWVNLTVAILIGFSVIFYYYNEITDVYENVRNEEIEIVNLFENYILNLSKKNNLTRNENITLSLYKNCDNYECVDGAIMEIRERMGQECKFRCENRVDTRNLPEGQPITDEYVNNNFCKYESSFLDILGENPSTRCNCDCTRAPLLIN